MTSVQSNKKLALGTAQIGMPYGVANQVGQPTLDAVFEILDTARALGYSMLDTAPAYGRAEELIGQWISARDEPAIDISSKLGALPEDLSTDALTSFVERCVRRSLERLQVPQLAILFVHSERDLWRHGGALVDALVHVRELGLAAAIGLSTYTKAGAAYALESRALDWLQLPLNLLDHRLLENDLLARLGERGVSIMARSAYLQGLLWMDPDHLPDTLGPAGPYLRALRELAARYGGSPASFALPWAIARDGVDCVVVGAETAAQVRGNVTAARVDVPRDLDEALSRSFRRVPLRIIDPTRWGTRA